MKVKTFDGLTGSQQEPEWSRTWPIYPGYYWFYGWAWKSRRGLPELHFVKVRQVVNGFAYTTNGHYLFEGEGAEGYWQRAMLPTLPVEQF